MRNDSTGDSATPASDVREAIPDPGAPRPITLAQADTGPSQTPASEAAGETVRLVVVAREGEVVTLPAGTSLDEIEIRDGDIVLLQPDGSVIIIENGVDIVPTIIVGDVEIPSETLFAALEGVAAAAGPEEGGSEGGSGANFNNIGQQEIGEAFGC
jgi:hypothetical protein